MVSVYVCMYVIMYVCLFVCLRVYIYIYPKPKRKGLISGSFEGFFIRDL